MMAVAERQKGKKCPEKIAWIFSGREKKGSCLATGSTFWWRIVGVREELKKCKTARAGLGQFAGEGKPFSDSF